MIEEDSLITCPYNISHSILRSRMATHLIKCRQQHPDQKLVLCPFNSTHDVPNPELQYHIENCPDRKKLDSFIYVPAETKLTPDSNLCQVELPPAAENWDEEATPGGSYLDFKNKVVEHHPVFRLPTGMTRSERKAFFRNEVSRFQNVSQSTSTDDDGSLIPHSEINEKTMVGVGRGKKQKC